MKSKVLRKGIVVMLILAFLIPQTAFASENTEPAIGDEIISEEETEETNKEEQEETEEETKEEQEETEEETKEEQGETEEETKKEQEEIEEETEEIDDEEVRTYSSNNQIIYVNANAKEDDVDTCKSLSEAAAKAEDGAIIIVQSDLTVTRMINVRDTNITIKSEDPDKPVTLTRGENFYTSNDPARSDYNPSMIEVNTNGEDTSLRLENIILDDGGKYKGKIFAQAYSGGDTSEDEELKKNNTECVQDAIIAAHGLNNNKVTVTLGKGVELKNYGGMSAVRVTAGAEVIMESGSKIYDKDVTDRKKTGEEIEDVEEIGPIGCIWAQSGIVTIDEGAVIGGSVGRAILLDGGEATINGEIKNITGDSDMWLVSGRQLKVDGAAIHIRGGAKATLNGKIENISEAASAVYAVGGDFYMNNGSLININGNSNVKAIQQYGDRKSDVYIDGEITGVNNDEAINININNGAQPVDENRALKTYIGKNAKIHDNHCNNGVIYVQASKGKVDFYGKIYDNTANSSIIYMAHNQLDTEFTMHEGAKICDNEADERIMVVSMGTFIMDGGEITNNSAKQYIIYVRNGGTFIMNGGKITDNTISELTDTAAIYYQANTYRDSRYYTNVILKDGLIEENTVNGQIKEIAISSSEYSSTKRYMTISDDIKIDDPNIYLYKYPQVTLTRPAEGVKFGNTSDYVLNKIKEAILNNGWTGDALASLWCQSDDDAIELEFGGMNIKENLPVFAAVMKTNADGTVIQDVDAAVRFYNTEKTGNVVKVTIPGGYETGYGLVIFQPSSNDGKMTISAPDSLDIDNDNSIEYSVSYDMSEALKNTIINGNMTMEDCTFTIELDNGLYIGTEQINVDSDIFEKISVSYYNSDPNSSATLTINCKLKDGWQQAADLTTKFRFTGELNPERYNAGDVLTASGYFVCTLNNGIDKFTRYVPANFAVTNLEKIKYFTITSESGRHGYIDPSGYIQVAEGENQSYFINAYNGYVIESLEVDGERVEDAEDKENYTYTFTDVDDNHIIAVTFKEEERHTSSGGYSLSEADGHYIIYHDGDETYRDGKYDNGDKVTVKDDIFQAPNGMELAGWSRRDGGSVNYLAGETLTMPGETVHLYAVWEDIEYMYHENYVSGYPDGTFGPDRSITRAEAATMFYKLLTKDVEEKGYFADISPNMWYTESVETLAGLGIINGYPDGTFRPDEPITRAEFVCMAVNFMDKDSGLVCDFSDVSPNMWYYGAVAAATQNGWISGYPDGNFRPENFITRAEAVSIINRMMDRSADVAYIYGNYGQLNTFSDVSASHWAHDYIMEAANSHEYMRENGTETWIDHSI